MILPVVRYIFPEPWTEIVGQLLGIELKAECIYLMVYDSRANIQYILNFSSNSKAGEILQNVPQDFIGRIIAVLFTDAPTSPIAMRIVEQKE